MDITLVKVFPVHEEKLKAFVSVVFDSCFMVNDIKIIQGKDGLFLSMPSRRKKTGEFKDVAHPLNNSFRRLLEERVLGEYRQMVDDLTPRRPDRDDDEDEGPSPGVVQGSSSDDGGPEVAPQQSTSPSGGGEQDDDPPEEPSPGGAAPEDPPPDEGPQGGKPSRNGSDDAGDGHEPSLEEVQKKHLQDSFWSVRGRS